MEMRTPNIDKIKVGDYYIYVTEIDYVKKLDSEKLIEEFWSEKYLGQNYDEDGVLKHQGPGVHATINIKEEIPHFFYDAYWFGLTFARSLRALEGKNLNLLNNTAWIIAAQDDHTPYWHTHRRNIDDPRLPHEAENVDSTYSFALYMNTLECGSPWSDLLFAHKDDVYSMPVEKGKFVFFDGDLFHKPQLVPKEFGWRYVIACDLLFED